MPLDSLSETLIQQFLDNLLSTEKDKMDLNKIMVTFKTLPERLDFAYDLYREAINKQSELRKATKEIPEELSKLITFLENFQIKILGVPKDSKDIPQHISEKMDLRIKMRVQNPGFIPGTTPEPAMSMPLSRVIEARIAAKKSDDVKEDTRIKEDSQKVERIRLAAEFRKLVDTAVLHNKGVVMVMNKESKGKDIQHQTKFFTSGERDVNRVILSNGVFYQNKGIRIAPFTTITKGMESHDKSEFGAYVINLDGELSVFRHIRMEDQVAHSSMSAQRAVIGSGEIRIDKQGHPTDITDSSGHYRPSVDHVFRVLEIFQEKGVDLSTIKVHLYRPDLSLAIKPTLTTLSNGDRVYTYKAQDLYNTISKLTPHEKIVRLRLNLDLLEKVVSDWETPIFSQFKSLIALTRKEIDTFEEDLEKDAKKEVSKIQLGDKISKKLQRQFLYLQQAAYQLEQDAAYLHTTRGKISEAQREIVYRQRMHALRYDNNPILLAISDAFKEEGHRFESELLDGLNREQLIEKHEIFLKKLDNLYPEQCLKEFYQLKTRLQTLYGNQNIIWSDGSKSKTIASLINGMKDLEDNIKKGKPISDDYVTLLLENRAAMDLIEKDARRNLIQHNRILIQQLDRAGYRTHSEENRKKYDAFERTLREESSSIEKLTAQFEEISKIIPEFKKDKLLSSQISEIDKQLNRLINRDKISATDKKLLIAHFNDNENFEDKIKKIEEIIGKQGSPKLVESKMLQITALLSMRISLEKAKTGDLNEPLANIKQQIDKLKKELVDVEFSFVEKIKKSMGQTPKSKIQELGEVIRDKLEQELVKKPPGSR